MGCPDLPPGLRLRPERDDDRDFLRALYATTREREMAMLDAWSQAEKQAFLDQQFAAQHASYRLQFPEARYDVIERDSQPIGRLYVEETETELRVMDIALVTDERGAGLGTSLMGALLDEARAGGRDVTLYVEPDNPATRLYARLGFVHDGEHAFYQRLRWRSGAAAGGDEAIS